MKDVYMQIDHHNAPAGTVLNEVAKDTAILQAEVMVKPLTPTRAFVIKGDNSPFALPSVYVGDKHPDDPSITGPFTVTKVKVDSDRLSGNKRYQIAYETSNQEATMCVCIDDRVSNVVKKEILEKLLEEIKLVSHRYCKEPFHSKGGYHIINTQSAVESLQLLIKQ